MSIFAIHTGSENISVAPESPCPRFLSSQAPVGSQVSTYRVARISISTEIAVTPLYPRTHSRARIRSGRRFRLRAARSLGGGPPPRDRRSRLGGL